MEKKKVCLTEEEILKNPNDNILGHLVRQKFWNIKDKKKISWMQTLKNFFSRN
jgi:hypothetical protein